MSEKYTPGPWEWQRGESGQAEPHWLDGDPNGSGGCVLRLSLETGLEGELYARFRTDHLGNWALITAAPDLLAACKLIASYDELISMLGTKEGTPRATLRAAIAKAEGRDEEATP